MLKVKNEIGGRDGIRDTVSETGNYSVREEERADAEQDRRESERNRLSSFLPPPHPASYPLKPPCFVVCLHQSSAKRADRTEETGELWRRRV